MSEEPRLQSFRRGSTGRVFQVEAHHHPDSAQHIVFWEDIQELFPGASSVLHGTVAVSRARDASFRFIEPQCIKYQPGKVLEVVGAEDLTTLMGAGSVATAVPNAMDYQQQLTLWNIEQWAMATAEITRAGTMYPPSDYSQSTVTSCPFKPLTVSTETDTSSVSDASTEGEENTSDEEDASVEHDSMTVTESVELVPGMSMGQSAHWEKAGIEDEVEDMEDGITGSPRSKFHEMASKGILLLRGLSHFAEYNSNANMTHDYAFGGNVDIDCGGNYAYYVNSVTDNNNDNNMIIAMAQENLEGNGSDPLSATSMFPTMYPPSPSSLKTPVTTTNTSATTISTTATPSPSPPAMLPSMDKPGFFKTFDKVARNDLNTSSNIPSIPPVDSDLIVGEDRYRYLVSQESHFGENCQFSQQQYQQQQSIQTQTHLQEQASAQEEKQNCLQALLSRRDYVYQHQRAQGKDDPATFTVVPVLETLSGSDSSLELHWQGCYPPPPYLATPIAYIAKGVDAKSAQRQYQGRKGAKNHFLSPFPPPPPYCSLQC
ncbi:hypothetical protein BGZ89_008293 [Linnemannia elongata]|nr:hypothetical protein BGZ89_008293 [Linnemannia elongata]